MFPGVQPHSGATVQEAGKASGSDGFSLLATLPAVGEVSQTVRIPWVVVHLEGTWAAGEGLYVRCSSNADATEDIPVATTDLLLPWVADTPNMYVLRLEPHTGVRWLLTGTAAARTFRFTPAS